MTKEVTKVDDKKTGEKSTIPTRHLRSAEFAFLTTITKAAKMITEAAEGSPSEGNLEAVGNIMEMIRASTMQYRSSLSMEGGASSVFEAMEALMDKLRLVSAKEVDCINMSLTLDALVEERDALKARLEVLPQEIANNLRENPEAVLDCLNITSQYNLRTALANAIKRKRRQNSSEGCGND